MPIKKNRKLKIWLSLAPIILHIIVGVVSYFLSKDMRAKIPRDDSIYWYRMIYYTFNQLIIIFYVSVIALLPVIYMAISYGCIKDYEGLLKHKRGIIVCMVSSGIFCICYLAMSIIISKSVFAWTQVRKHYIILPSSIVIACIYVVASIMFAGDFIEELENLRIYGENIRRRPLEKPGICKFLFCLSPLIVHIILVILFIVFYHKLPPTNGDRILIKRHNSFKFKFIAYCASSIFLFPIISILKYYTILGDCEKVFEKKQDIKSCMFGSIICAIVFLGIAVAGIIYGLTDLGFIKYNVLFFIISVVAVLYLCVVIMFTVNFFDKFKEVDMWLKEKRSSFLNRSF